jgi:hypothetical protein
MQTVELKVIATSEIAKEQHIIRVQLEARETSWEYAPGRLVSGYVINGQVPACYRSVPRILT